MVMQRSMTADVNKDLSGTVVQKPILILRDNLKAVKDNLQSKNSLQESTLLSFKM